MRQLQSLKRNRRSQKINMSFVILGLLSVIFLQACTNIEPWERNYMAESHMLLDPYPLDSILSDHIYFSREGTSGGYGLGGGGCGCN
ncbi:DUF4266 domain-containing protein [Candidatus Nucleicultrix amoebiphila]|jgi:hypothetical protein|nr:DUF4266 domain-containing protein [Candidatus Nucleicultrix amoebiphila]